MGKVSKWLRGLFRMKKDKENMDNSNAKTKKRWCFGKYMKLPSQRVTVENDSTWMMSCMPASEKEQNKHAIVVSATATAVADAQAAVDVVKLTSDGTGTLFSGREKWVAIKIQSVYRGHLEHIKSTKENDKEEKVKHDMDEIETINIDLEHSVAKLLSENKRLHNEFDHLKQIYKD
nr:hypothetical protein [Tanacetum cinerariifolium]